MKNKFLLAFLVLVACICVSMFAASSTIAYYKTATTSVADVARVALWGLGDITTETIDLFSNSYAADAATSSAHAESTTDIIAPGTSGSSSIVLSGATDTEVDYKIEISVNAGTNFTNTDLKDRIEIRFVGNDTWVKVSSITDENKCSYTKKYFAGTYPQSTDFALEWRWTYGSTDEEIAKDTAIASATPAAICEFEITIVAEQILTAAE